MDDGNRQLAIALGLDAGQFELLDTKLGGINGAVNKLAENISDPDTSVAAEISLLRAEVGIRLTAINESIVTASSNLGKWLAAIAVAAANPDDNSAQVQEQIDKLTTELKSTTNAVDAAVESNQS